MPRVDFTLYLITDRRNLPNGQHLVDQVEAALRGGLPALQLREKDMTAQQLLPLAQQLRRLTSGYGAKLFINSCLQTAIAVQADGVHLPSDNPPVSYAREQLGSDALIGVSTHSLAEIDAASQAGADFVTFGPVYPTPAKIDLGEPVGLEALRAACDRSPIPVFALGGVTADRLSELRSSGCSRFSCIGAILHAENPETATRAILAAE